MCFAAALSVYFVQVPAAISKHFSQGVGIGRIGFDPLPGLTHRPLSSSFLGVPYRILKNNNKKKLLRSLWVRCRCIFVQSQIETT